MEQQQVAGQRATPIGEHDLEHRNLRLQLFLVRQLVLRLYATQYGDEAPRRVRECLASMHESVHEEGLHPAEHAMLLDESAEALDDVDEHLELVMAGAL